MYLDVQYLRKASMSQGSRTNLRRMPLHRRLQKAWSQRQAQYLERLPRSARNMIQGQLHKKACQWSHVALFTSKVVEVSIQGRRLSHTKQLAKFFATLKVRLDSHQCIQTFSSKFWFSGVMSHDAFEVALWDMLIQTSLASIGVQACIMCFWVY